MFGDAVPAGPTSTYSRLFGYGFELACDPSTKPSRYFCESYWRLHMIDANIQSGDVMVVEQALEPKTTISY